MVVKVKKILELLEGRYLPIMFYLAETLVNVERIIFKMLIIHN